MNSSNLKYQGLVAVDFDGTLFCSSRSRKVDSSSKTVPATICEENHAALKTLGARKICRVIVTGRSLFSFLGAAEKLNLDIDYLIFSSGAGLLRWSGRELLRCCSLSSEEIQEIGSVLKAEKADFMIQAPIPDNHHLYYWSAGEGHPDFYRRLEIYREWSRPLAENEPGPEEASQFIAVLPPQTRLKPFYRKLKNFSLIRATSPIDHESIWLEIFPPTVNKGLATEELTRSLGLSAKDVLGVGNDTNDLDLLEWAGTAYTVSDAHGDLSLRFPSEGTCGEGGFARAVAVWLSRRSD